MVAVGEGCGEAVLVGSDVGMIVSVGDKVAVVVSVGSLVGAGVKVDVGSTMIVVGGISGVFAGSFVGSGLSS